MDEDKYEAMIAFHINTETGFLYHTEDDFVFVDIFNILWKRNKTGRISIKNIMDSLMDYCDGINKNEKIHSIDKTD